jgi:hypothetical protein
LIDASEIERLKELRAAGVATYTRDGAKVSVSFFPAPPNAPPAMTRTERAADMAEREARAEEWERRIALGAARGTRRERERGERDPRVIAAARAERDAFRRAAASADAAGGDKEPG